MTRVRRVEKLLHQNRARMDSAKPRRRLGGQAGVVLRARRSAEKREGWRVRIARLFLVASIFVLIAGLWQQRVQVVDVEGVVLAPAETVEAFASALIGVSWLRPQVELTTTRIASLPWVEDVRIHRRLPAGLVVEIDEAWPVARMRIDEVAYGVDRRGRVFAAPPGLNLDDLPQARGLIDANGGADSLATLHIGQVLDGLERGPWPFGAGIEMIDVSAPRQIALHTRGEVTVLLSPERILDQLHAAMAAWPELEPKAGDRLDLRFARQVVLARDH